MRPFLDRDSLRKYLLAEGIEQEGGLAVKIAAARRRDERPDQPGCDRRLEQHRRLASRDLAGAQARQRAPAGIAAERLGIREHAGHARRAVPVVALHQAAVLGNY